MGIIDNAKELADLIQKAGNTDLYRRIVELQGEVVSLAGKNVQLETDLATAKSLLAQRAQMQYRDSYYWVAGDEVPFCPKCWEVDRIQTHLSPIKKMASGDERLCHNCNTRFEEGPRRSVMFAVSAGPREFPF